MLGNPLQPPAPRDRMPITYRHDPDQQVTFTTWSGAITADEIRQHWAALLSDPGPMSARRSVADMRDTIPAVSADELMHLIRRVLAPRLDGGGWRLGVVVASPAQYGKVRQFDAMSDWMMQTRIFDDPAAALAWVREA